MSINGKIITDLFPSNPDRQRETAIQKASEVNVVDIEKYIERLDQDRRESEQRIRDERKESEDRIRNERKESEKYWQIQRDKDHDYYIKLCDRLDEDRKLSEERLEKKFDQAINDIRTSKYWIMGVCFATILGIAAMVVAILVGS